MRRLLVVGSSLCLAACATAGAPDQTGDDVVVPDADTTVDPPDANQIDPPDANNTPQPVTLSQTTNTTITTMNSLACGNANYTVENHFYRVFKLSDFGITTSFHATHVDFGVEDATTTAGTQTLQVRLWTMTGATPLVANMTQLYGQNVNVPSTASGTVVGVDLTMAGGVLVPVGSTLVVELFSAGHSTTGNYFYPGSNALSETGPSYVRAPQPAPTGCGAGSTPDLTEITPYSAIDGAAQVSLVLSVSGTKP
jgi:hypothetical protein